MTQDNLIRERSVIAFTATTWPKQIQEFCERCHQQEAVAHICGYFDGSKSVDHRFMPNFAAPSKEVAQLLEKLIKDQRQDKFRVLSSWDACAQCLGELALMWTGRDDAMSMVAGLISANQSVTIVGLLVVEPGLHGQVTLSIITGKGRLTAREIMQQMQKSPFQSI